MTNQIDVPEALAALRRATEGLTQAGGTLALVIALMERAADTGDIPTLRPITTIPRRLTFHAGASLPNCWMPGAEPDITTWDQSRVTCTACQRAYVRAKVAEHRARPVVDAIVDGRD